MSITIQWISQQGGQNVHARRAHPSLSLLLTLLRLIRLIKLIGLSVSPGQDRRRAADGMMSNGVLSRTLWNVSRKLPSPGQNLQACWAEPQPPGPAPNLPLSSPN